MVYTHTHTHTHAHTHTQIEIRLKELGRSGDAERVGGWIKKMKEELTGAGEVGFRVSGLQCRVHQGFVGFRVKGLGDVIYISCINV